MKKTKTKFLRAVCLLLIFVLLLPTASCKKKQKDRKFDAEEVLAAARALMPSAEILNHIFYGSGLRGDGTNDGGYAVVLQTELDIYGFSTLKELKKMTTDVYSTGVSDQIFSTRLFSVIDEDNILVSYARYFERPSDGAIMVRTDYRASYAEKMTVDLDRATCDRAKGQVVYVYIPYVVSDGNGNVQEGRLHVGLIEEKAGWRLDTIPYTNYNSYADYFK